MQIQIYAQDVELPDPLRAFVEQKLRDVLAHVSERLTRVEVHLKDLNSEAKHGVDKRCLIEARSAGLAPVAVEVDAESTRDAVQQAVEKLERALAHRLDKRKNH